MTAAVEGFILVVGGLLLVFPWARTSSGPDGTSRKCPVADMEHTNSRRRSSEVLGSERTLRNGVQQCRDEGIESALTMQSLPRRETGRLTSS